ncbi:MAG: SOS response-associated peptidase [Mycobacterium sp.]
MCGRFAVTTDPALLAERIRAVNEVPGAADAGAPSYNVAPTANVATVVSRHAEPGDEPTRRVLLMRWGLVPPWAKAGPGGAPQAGSPLLINARADRVTTSPAYRSAARHKRCLVPMDGFYEWRVEPDTPAGKKARKTPFYIHRSDGETLFMAGLWSVWRPDRYPDRPPLRSCTIVTTDAVGELAAIHDRMPLIMAEDEWDSWLDPDAPADTALLARPPDVGGVAVREVSTLVNSVRNNGPELIEPARPEPEQPTLL